HALESPHPLASFFSLKGLIKLLVPKWAYEQTQSVLLNHKHASECIRGLPLIGFAGLSSEVILCVQLLI
ncbi:unnamed protein product, partial [Brassica oleracea]